MSSAKEILAFLMTQKTVLEDEFGEIFFDEEGESLEEMLNRAPTEEELKRDEC